MKRKISRKMVSCRINETEYNKLIERYKTTICRNKSEYIRKMLLGKPLIILYRNRSLDDFIEVAVQIRRDWRVLLAKEGFTPTEKEEFSKKISLIEEMLIKISEPCSQT